LLFPNSNPIAHPPHPPPQKKKKIELKKGVYIVRSSKGCNSITIHGCTYWSWRKIETRFGLFTSHHWLCCPRGYATPQNQHSATRSFFLGEETR
jgi:hypothetical protein